MDIEREPGASAHLTSLEGPKQNLASRTARTYLKPNNLSMAHPQSGSPGPLGKSLVRPCAVPVRCRAVSYRTSVMAPAVRRSVRRPCVGRASAVARCGTRPHAGRTSVAADLRCGVLRPLCGPELEPTRALTRTRTNHGPEPVHTPYIPRTNPYLTTDTNPYLNPYEPRT